MKTRGFAFCALIACAIVLGGLKDAAAAKAPKPPSAKKFDALATTALEAMKAKAAELKIGGVAVVNYAPGETVTSWSSKMAVVGRMKDAPTDTSKGNNLLGIAYAKSAEMADTLVNSGTSKRPPMTGEFGWQGGVVEKVKGGYAIVSFSGGKSEDDVQVSKAGLAEFKKGL
jgi:hypothetical protein